MRSGVRQWVARISTLRALSPLSLLLPALDHCRGEPGIDDLVAQPSADLFLT